MQPATYPGTQGNIQYSSQPVSGPYSMTQPHHAVYGNNAGVAQQQQQQPGLMLGNPGPVQQGVEYSTVPQYGFADNTAFHSNQQIPQALGVVGPPSDPRVHPPVNQSMGASTVAGGMAVNGRAAGLQPAVGLTQGIGQGMGISEGFPCVRLRGIPFDANEQDVEGWLETEPLDIILVRRNGTLTGEAYVLLRLPIQVEHVMSKNKTYLGQRYIEVNLAKKLDFYREIYVMVRDDEESKTAVRSQYRSTRDHVSRSSRQDSPDRKRSSRRDSSRDRSSKRHHRDEPRERDRIDADSDERPGRSDWRERPAAPEQPHTGVLKMRGLPFSATADEVVQWFGDSAPEITSDRVHIVMSSGNRAMGTAYVQCASATDAKSAMVMDRKTMGSRYIELFASSADEASRYGAPFS